MTGWMIYDLCGGVITGMGLGSCCKTKLWVYIIFLQACFHFRIASGMCLPLYLQCGAEKFVSFLGQKKRAIHNAFLVNKNSLLVLLVHVTTAVLYMDTMKLTTFSLLQSIRYPPHNSLGFRGPPHIVKVQNTADHVQVSTGDLNRGLKSTYDSNGKENGSAEVMKCWLHNRGRQVQR